MELFGDIKPFSQDDLDKALQRKTRRAITLSEREERVIAVHEAGHAMYEHNRPARLYFQPVGQPRGASVHESQSLMVEIQAGHLWTMRDGKAARCEIFPEREKALEAALRTGAADEDTRPLVDTATHLKKDLAVDVPPADRQRSRPRTRPSWPGVPPPASSAYPRCPAWTHSGAPLASRRAPSVQVRHGVTRCSPN